MSNSGFGTVPTMIVERNGSPVRINVSDYNPETDRISEGASQQEQPTNPVAATGSTTIVRADGTVAAIIPDNWRDPSVGVWPDIKSWAAAVSPTPVASKADCVAALEAWEATGKPSEAV